MIGSINHLAEAIKADLLEILPFQRKTQRNKLAFLVATMLDTRTAITMVLSSPSTFGNRAARDALSMDT